MFTLFARPWQPRLRRPRKLWRPVLLGLVLMSFLAGCQVDLHTKLSEADANDILGALLAAGLDARKHSLDAGKTWNISVEEAQTVPAIGVLRDNALPHERRATLGDLFKKEGLISSPTEERVRFLYGIQQSLADTLSKIDGVIVARVHIVLPNNDPLAPVTKPSSASIFVKYRRGGEIQSLVPAIKNLVVHAVEGLEYNQVTVTLVPASGSRAADAQAAASEPAKSSTSPLLLPIVGALVLLLVLLTGFGVWRFKKGWRPLRSNKGFQTAGDASDVLTTDGAAH
jgi:type III secretion protein J